MEIIKKEKVKSWREIVLEIKTGEVNFYDWGDRGNIRTAISDKIKYSHPDRGYETEKALSADNEICLQVKRIK